MLNLFFIFAKPAFADLIVPWQMPIDNRIIGQETLWGRFIPGIIQLLLFLAFIFAVVYLLWGGFTWATSGGKKESLEKARGKITYAFLGLVLVLLSFTFLYLFGDLFGVNLRYP